jgi:two-component system chemotaxis response regulator CheY
MTYDILIVDDSDVTRAMIRKTLSLAKIPLSHCYEAANGREALDILDERWVDLVLADLNMPVMGGQELIRVMRASRLLKSIPVIVVTSESCSKDQLEGDWGVSAYVRKPFTPEQIRDAFVGLVGPQDQAIDSGWLLQQFGDVLETMAFMFIEPVPEDGWPVADTPFLRGLMAFDGAASGVMALSVPRSLAVEMAANALGIESDDVVAAGHAGDMVGELLNITCGHVAEALAKGRPVGFEPPIVTEHEPARWAELTSGPASVCGLVEGRPVVVGIGVRSVG